MGGKSSEREVSLISGREVVSNLNKSKYKAIPLILPKRGNMLDIFKSVKSKKVDVVFIAMHGTDGEDGTIQGMLELLDIPYTGSGVLASAIGMDKIAFRKIISFEGIDTPRYLSIEKGQDLKSLKLKLGNFPFFVKPHNQGSSVGASIASGTKDLQKSINKAFKYSDQVLIEEYVDGLEVTCAVLGNKDLIALPIVEIHPNKGDFFDYNSKYTESGAEEIAPAKISKSLTDEIKMISIKCYKAINCKGFARVDLILKKNKLPLVLEINTIPGLTPTSLLPKAALAASMSYSQLLDKIISYALNNKHDLKN